MREVVLKPCPFCGKVPGIEQTESGYSGPEDAITATFQVRCEICGVGFERKTIAIRKRPHKRWTLNWLCCASWL